MFAKNGLEDIDALAFGPQNKTFFAGCRGIVVMDATDAKELGRFANGRFKFLQVFDEGKRLVSVDDNSDNNKIKVWDLKQIMAGLQPKSDKK